METRTALDGNQNIVHVYRDKAFFVDIETKAHYSELFFLDTQRYESAEDMCQRKVGRYIIALHSRGGGKTAKLLDQALESQKADIIDKACELVRQEYKEMNVMISKCCPKIEGDLINVEGSVNSFRKKLEE